MDNHHLDNHHEREDKMILCNNCSTEHEAGKSCSIPDADYYVTSIDTFMSNWGEAEDRTNLCVVPCPDQTTAEVVLRYVKRRSDTARAQICLRKPRPRGRLLSNLSAWIAIAKRHEKAGLI